jgi:hypothetical protein
MDEPCESQWQTLSINFLLRKTIVSAINDSVVIQYQLNYLRPVRDDNNAKKLPHTPSNV